MLTMAFGLIALLFGLVLYLGGQNIRRVKGLLEAAEMIRQLEMANDARDSLSVARGNRIKALTATVEALDKALGRADKAFEGQRNEINALVGTAHSVDEVLRALRTRLDEQAERIEAESAWTVGFKDTAMGVLEDQAKRLDEQMELIDAIGPTMEWLRKGENNVKHRLASLEIWRGKLWATCATPVEPQDRQDRVTRPAATTPGEAMRLRDLPKGVTLGQPAEHTPGWYEMVCAPGVNPDTHQGISERGESASTSASDRVD